MSPFLADVTQELNRAMRDHAPMNSLHEAFAVINEEVDELWKETCKKRQKRKPANIRLELIQIAAMAWRAAIDLGLEGEEPTLSAGEKRAAIIEAAINMVAFESDNRFDCLKNAVKQL